MSSVEKIDCIDFELYQEFTNPNSPGFQSGIIFSHPPIISLSLDDCPQLKSECLNGTVYKDSILRVIRIGDEEYVYLSKKELPYTYVKQIVAISNITPLT